MITEKIVDGSHNPPPKQSSGFPMLSARNVGIGAIEFDQFRYITKEAFELERKRADLRAGDVLLTIVGTIGRAAVIPETGQNFALQRSVAMIRSRELLPKFCMYQFLSPRVQNWLKANARGSAQQGIYLKTLGTLPMFVPRVDEQQRIVAEIEEQFTRLEAAVAALQSIQTKLKRYRAAVLNAAWQGKLVPTEAELARKAKRRYETGEQLLQRILAERRKQWLARQSLGGGGTGKYKEPAAPDIGNLPKLPEGWRWVGTEQVTAGIENAMTIGPFGSNLMVKDYRDSGVPLIFVREIRSENFRRADTRYILPDKAAELRTHKVRSGDVVITKMGEPPGDTAIYPADLPDAIATSDCIKLTPNLSGTTAAFLKYIIRSQAVKTQIERITRGVAQKKMSLARFKSVALPLPPLTEQKRIVADVEQRFSVIEEMEAVVGANLQRASRLWQSILTKAFSGGLSPVKKE
jgi:type I restriction enzyme, S subunit